MTELIRLVERYVEIPAVSGAERPLREQILKDLSGCCDCRVDPLGNILAVKKGANAAKVSVLLDAHMDEVGLIVTGVTERGFVRFAKVGGIDDRVLFGRRVRIGDVTGVLGGTPVHLLDEKARKKVHKADDLLIDIGAKDRQDALQYIKPGDTAVFDTGFLRLGGQIAARALDDRVGCAVLVQLLRSEIPYDLQVSFTVQEEVGCRGAAAAAFTVAPQAAIAVEATTAADIHGVPEEQRVCSLGGGAVVSFMDGGTVYDRAYYQAALELAGQRGIAAQPKQAVAGGNNAGAIHKSRGGVRTLALSLPCRYIHSGLCVADQRDIQSLYDLTVAAAGQIASGAWA